MERIFTILWLLLIPTQLGKHFWLPESSVMGVRIDYLSIIIYLTDIVWFLWVISKRKDLRIEVLKNKIFTFQNFILLLFIAVNIVFATAKWAALYRWLRIGQWFLTWQLVKKDKSKISNYLKIVIPIWIIVEVFLGLAQVINGGSLNGIWWWLGERRFVYGGIGIAQVRFLDGGWIRAYGTFSHPNSLAGFLLLAWWWWKNQKFLINKVLYWIVNWSAILGIILTGSRTTWVLMTVLLIIEQLKIKNYKLKIGSREQKKELIGKMCLVSGIICLALGMISINYRIRDFVGGWDVNSFRKREMLALASIKMVEKYPLFGVGAGNFVELLPKFQNGDFYWMQPVHNIILLALSEIGILGIIALTIIGYEFGILNIKWKNKWWLLVIVGITGMVDHYWLTLPQNAWLLAIVLGLI